MKKHLFFLLAISMIIATSVKAQIPTNGLIAWYPFTGNTIDSSGNGNNGTNYGATLTKDRFGNANSAYSFDGASYIYTNNNLCNFRTNDFTIAAWYFGQIGSNYGEYILSKRDVSSFGNFFTLSKHPGFEINQSSNNDYNFIDSNLGNIGLGAWKQVVVTRKGNLLKVYLGGKVLYAVYLSIIHDIANSAKFYIGGVDPSVNLNNPLFHGLIDDIRIYNRALDSTEIRALYHEGGYGTITSFTPIMASTGVTDTIKGSGFTGATAVSFGGKAASYFTVVNDSTITAVVGSGASGNVYVTTASGGIDSLGGFTYSSLPSNGLIAWYPFTGNTIDSSGNGNNGTNYGATLTTDRFGKANSAYSFDGSSYITAPTNNFPIGNQTRSFSLWFNIPRYPNSGNGTFIFMNYGYCDSNKSCGFAIDSLKDDGTQLQFFSWVTDLNIPQKISFNKFHHIVCTYNGQVDKLYLDGILIGANNQTWNTILSQFNIGKNNQTNGTFPAYTHGIIDDIRIYNRALDSTEIRALYHEGGYGTITSFTPIMASTGITDTIKGSGFTGATAVSFGGKAASYFTVVNDSTITAVVGSGASGNVYVTTASGGIDSLGGFTYSSLPANGLIAWYPFTGNTIDSSGNGNNGTNYGATLTRDRFGNANSAYSLNAINQKINLITSDSWLGVNNFSFSLWFNTDTSTFTQSIFSKRPTCGGVGEQFFELTKSANTDSIVFWTNGFVFVVPFVPNAWNHFLYTKTSPTTSIIYINNVGYSVTHAAFSITGNHPIGTSSSSACASWYPIFYNGKIDDIRIYNRALDSTEVRALYNEGGFGCPANIWTGTNSTDWNDATNWSSGVVPTSTTIATITATFTNQPSLSSDVVVGDIALNNNINLNGHTLTINGAVTGTGSLIGSATSSLNIGGTAGTINFDANNNSLQNLTINGTVTLGNTLKLHNKLIANTGGTLNTGGNLILKSMATSSAIVEKVNGIINGIVKVEIYIPKGYSAHRDLGVCVSGAGTIANTWGDSLKNYLVYNYNAASGWATVPNTSSLNQYVGYRVLVSGHNNPVVPSTYISYMNSDVTLAYSGTLLSGNQSIPLTGGADKFSFISNPYASQVDFNALTKSGLYDGYWYLDPTTLYGNYENYNYFGTNIGLSNVFAKSAAQYLQPSQGFFVCSNSATPSLTFTESAKNNNNSQVSIFGTSTPLNRIATGLFANGKNLDGAVVVFNNNFSKAISKEDGLKINNQGENLTFSVAGKDLCANGWSQPTANDELPLHLYQLNKNTPYSLRLDASQFVGNGLNAYLKDNLLNNQSLLKGDSNMVAFATTTDTFSTRFSIIFKPTTLPVESIVATAKALQNNQVAINWSVVNEKNVSSYQVQRSIDGINFTDLVIVLPTSKNNYSYIDMNIENRINYYRVKALGNDGNVNYSNISSIDLSNNKYQLSIYPNPVSNGSFKIGLSTVGKYRISLANKDGQIIYKTQLNHTATNALEKIVIGKSFAAGCYTINVIDEEGNAFNKEIIIK